MSTNTLVQVEGTAWGIDKDTKAAVRKIRTSNGMVSKLGLSYTVSAHNMKTDIDEPVEGYYAIYRDDTNKFLGPVKSDNPVLVQNADTFNVLEPLMSEKILVPECVNIFDGGSKLWGCFKYNAPFEVAGDKFTDYLVVINDHLKPDGKLQIVSSPVRMQCMNQLGAILPKSNMKFTIPAIVNEDALPGISKTILNAYERTVKSLNDRADDMLGIKIDEKGIAEIIDMLFPFVEDTSKSNHDRANASIEHQRDTFITCLNADDIANFRNTAYGVYNALADYVQHYHTSYDRGSNLETRMSLIPGVRPEAVNDNIKVNKFLNSLADLKKVA